MRAELTARESADARAYWRTQLAGHPGTALPRFATGGEPVRWAEERVVPDDVGQAALRAMSARFGVPLKHVLLACHLSALGLVCGQTDVVTGVVADGRPEEDGGEDVIGLFLHFLPHRQDLAGRLTWRAIAQTAFAVERDGLAHRRYPLADIRTDTGQERPFPALFNYTEFAAYRQVAAVLTDRRRFEHTEVPLLVNAGRDIGQERVVLTLNTDGRVIPPRALKAIARLYAAVLDLMPKHERLADADIAGPLADVGRCALTPPTPAP